MKEENPEFEEYLDESLIQDSEFFSVDPSERVRTTQRQNTRNDAGLILAESIISSDSKLNKNLNSEYNYTKKLINQKLLKHQKKTDTRYKEIKKVTRTT